MLNSNAKKPYNDNTENELLEEKITQLEKRNSWLEQKLAERMEFINDIEATLLSVSMFNRGKMIKICVSLLRRHKIYNHKG